MTAFWKNLHLLARGQLFNGGYLTDETGPPAQKKPAVEPLDGRKRASDAPSRPLPARLAACR